MGSEGLQRVSGTRLVPALRDEARQCMIEEMRPMGAGRDVTVQHAENTLDVNNVSVKGGVADVATTV